MATYIPPAAGPDGITIVSTAGILSAPFGTAMVDRTGVRAINTTYQNLTGRPLLVTAHRTAAGAFRMGRTSGVADAAVMDGSAAAGDFAITAVVPNAWFYAYTGGVGALTSWLEG